VNILFILATDLTFDWITNDLAAFFSSAIYLKNRLKQTL
jgi:hypothetical protein